MNSKAKTKKHKSVSISLPPELESAMRIAAYKHGLSFSRMAQALMVLALNRSNVLKQVVKISTK